MQQWQRHLGLGLVGAFLTCVCSASVPLPTATSTPPVAGLADCAATVTSHGTGPAFVAIAERAPAAIAVILEPNGAERGRLELVSAVPELALDRAGNQLVVLCENVQPPQLIAFDLSTLQEHWRVAFPDPLTTKAPGGLPTLAVARDGTLVFALHTVALKADAGAPGGSRDWLSIHDANNGALVAQVELPDCGTGRVLTGADAAVYVVCRDGVRTVSTRTWQVVRWLPVSTLGPIGLVGDAELIGVTRELQALGWDLRTGLPLENSTWSNRAGPVVGYWGRLTFAPDGSKLWILTSAASATNELEADTLTEIDLVARRRIDTTVPEIRGVGLVGTRVVYFVQGRLRSTDGALDARLVSGAVNHWTILSGL